MTSKSKNKGNTLEREIRDFLNKIYNSEEFARTPSSGAIMGLGNSKRNAGLEQSTQRTLGSDLICPDWFPFSVECKSYADKPNYSTIIKSNDSTLDSWLGETCFDSINLGLIPILFFKTTRKGTHCALPSIFLPKMSNIKYYSIYEDFIIMGLEQFEANKTEIQQFAIDNLQDLFDWIISSNHVTELLKTLKHSKSKKSKADNAGIQIIHEMIESRIKDNNE